MTGKIAVVGAMNMDVVVTTPELPKKGESVLGSPIQLYPGGKGANQAVAAALVDGDVALISRRGNDDYGTSLLESAKQAGVDVSHVGIDDSEQTGTALIAVDDHGDNMIIISPGANRNITEINAAEALSQIDDLAVVSVCGELPLPTIRAALEAARQLGATSVLNLSPYNPDAIDLLSWANVLVVNQHEAADITGITDPTNDWQRTSAEFTALGSTLVVVTLGDEGAVILDGSSNRIETVAAVQVVAVDTTGCGDAFTGSMCVELAAGRPITQAVEFAVRAAGYAAKSAGAQVSYGTRAQVTF